MRPAVRRPHGFWPPGPRHAALQALPVVTCVARISEAHPGPGIPGMRAGEWRPSRMRPSALSGLHPNVAATCVARVSEAHPGTRIPGTRAGEWRPSPDAAFGLIRATPGAGVIQPVGSREKRIAPTTP